MHIKFNYSWKCRSLLDMGLSCTFGDIGVGGGGERGQNAAECIWEVEMRGDTICWQQLSKVK